MPDAPSRVSTRAQTDVIRVRGARAHNLRGVDLDLPRDSMVVFTGLSGSGKSSLAFDTIFAEGQRRYVESLSSYARMFLDQVDRPDVDLIEGLSPAVSIDQKSTNHNPRSTVGTITEIHDYLRLLWARIGVPHCPVCGEPVVSQTVQQIADQITELPEGTRFQLLAPVVVRQKGEHAQLFQDLASEGFARAVVDGTLVQLSSAPVLDKRLKHDVSVVVDRLVAGPSGLRRLTDSLKTGLRLSGGVITVDLVDGGDPRTFTEKLSCPDQHPLALTEIEPRTFSFNNPIGACPTCSGLGVMHAVDEELMLGDQSLSLSEGVVLPWAQSGPGLASHFQRVVRGLAEAMGFSVDTPWNQLPDDVRDVILNGSDIQVTVTQRTRFANARRYAAVFEGTLPYVRRKHAEADDEKKRQRYARYLRELPCRSCGGARLRPEVLAVTIDGASIADVSNLDLGHAADFVDGLELSQQQQTISAQVLREIRGRLQFLLDVGLDYLTLARTAGTLSGGEAQRIRLATQVGAGLTGVLYVLDEPSIGLHQRDNDRLLETLQRLRDLGNTLLVVEHDEDTIRAADWVVDVGPLAGVEGGTVVHSGPVEDLLTNTASITADYLSGRRSIAVPAVRRPVDTDRQLTVVGARENNLQDVDVHFPLGAFVAVTGVSGSGKSTLVNDILYRVLANQLNGAQLAPGVHSRVLGLDHLDKVVHVDQAPIGRTPRSNPATYTGVFDRVRALFAETSEARVRGYTSARFSFNVKGGRCEACSGDGTVRIEMNFLPDVYVSCEVCGGTRYNRETLQIRYKDRTIAEVLDMPIAEAAEFFAAHRIISRYLRTLVDVGLGYVRLGQSATTLSGGEAQRVKLATELQRRTRGRSLYVLDEPTTGLHFEDVRRLLAVLHELVDKGNTVVTIEHNLDVIKTADWVVDLGPEGGRGGGQVLATGTPELIATREDSWTGRYLKAVLAQTSGQSARPGAQAHATVI